jgi:HEAT repeat protein
VELQVVDAAQALLRGDFETSTSAARWLIRLGEPAVPYLGHMAMTEPDPEGRLPIVLGRILGVAPSDRVGPLLESPYESVQVAAAQACGERRLAEHAPRLVDLLESPSEKVRRGAVTALRRTSNQFFGYRPDGSARERAEAAAQWRQLWPAAR